MEVEKTYKKLVMLVDDNETDNFIHRRVLEMGNFSKQIIVKNSGKTALEYLEANKNDPELIPEVSSDNKKDIDRIVDNDYVIHFITKPLSEDSIKELKQMV